MKKKAFTLVELLLVIAVVAILFIVILSKVNFAADRAKDAGVLTDFRSFHIGVHHTIRENGLDEDMSMADFNVLLKSNLDKKLRFSWNGTEFQSKAVNPYGYHYVITKNGNEIKVYSIKNQGDFEVIDIGSTNVYADNIYSTGKVLIIGENDGTEELNIENFKDNTSVQEQEKVVIKDGSYPVIVDGGIATPSTAEPGDTVSVTADVPVGNTFIGWSVPDDIEIITGDTNTESFTFKMPSNTVFIEANYYAVGSYVVNFVADEHGTITGSSNIGVAPGGTINQFPTTKGNNGYMFDKWVNSADDTDVDNTTVINSNMTVKAVFKELVASPGEWFAVTSYWDGTKSHYYISGFSAVYRALPNPPTDIVIPSVINGYQIERITGYAFDAVTAHYGNEPFNARLTSVALQEGIQVIDQFEDVGSSPALFYGAFQGCTNLKSVTLPSSITKIDRRAFNGCTSLESIAIPDGATLGYNAFRNCSNLKTVDIGEGLTLIPEYTFYGCSNLETVNLPSTLKTIKYYAFYGCSDLVNMSLPSGLTTLEYNAFTNCESLRTIRIPAGVTEIGKISLGVPTGGVFENCRSLKNVVIENGVEKINSIGAFKGCSSLESIYIPDSVVLIGKESFKNCTSLTDVRLPANLQVDWYFDGTRQLGDYVFENCTSLQTIALNEKIQAMPAGTFKGCTSLSSINFPTKLTKFYPECFMNCTSLTTLTFPTYMGRAGMDSGTRQASIGNSAFEGCTGLTSITLPDGYPSDNLYRGISFGTRAFANCTNLGTVTIPRNAHQAYGDSFLNVTRVVYYDTYNLVKNYKPWGAKSTN